MERQPDRAREVLITYPDASQPPAAVTTMEYVGGPYAGRREAVQGRLPLAAVLVSDDVPGAGRGLYRRSVRCADDGILRYTWQER